MSTYTFKPTLEVSVQDIEDLCCSALEGGINYWCAKIENDFSIAPDCSYGHEMMGRGYPVVLFEDHEDGTYTPHWWNRSSIERGMAVMATKYPWHYANVINDNADAETADVFVQCALFGELVYG
jgi:hypothetical protein